MVKTTRILREHIIEGAYKVILHEGFKNFHARNIAQQIKCSTQPIYREFKNLAELKVVVSERVVAKHTNLFNETAPTSISEMTRIFVDSALSTPAEFQRFFLQDLTTSQALKEVTKNYFNTLEGNSSDEGDAKFNFFWHYCVGKSALAILDPEEADETAFVESALNN